MSINVQSMYGEFQEAAGLSDSPRFRNAFTLALNDAINDMRILAHLGTLSRVTGISDTIDLDADEYQAILTMGVKRYIQESGEWTKDPDPQLQVKWERTLSKARLANVQDSPSTVWEGAHGYKQSDE